MLRCRIFERLSLSSGPTTRAFARTPKCQVHISQDYASSSREPLGISRAKFVQAVDVCGEHFDVVSVEGAVAEHASDNQTGGRFICHAVATGVSIDIGVLLRLFYGFVRAQSRGTKIFHEHYIFIASSKVTNINAEVGCDGATHNAACVEVVAGVFRYIDGRCSDGVTRAPLSLDNLLHLCLVDYGRGGRCKCCGR